MSTNLPTNAPDPTGARRPNQKIDLAFEEVARLSGMDLSPTDFFQKFLEKVLDGIEAARRIRLELPDATILILTGSSIAADVDRARQAGVAGFLTKDRIGTQLVGAILEAADH